MKEPFTKSAHINVVSVSYSTWFSAFEVYGLSKNAVQRRIVFSMVFQISRDFRGTFFEHCHKNTFQRNLRERNRCLLEFCDKDIYRNGTRKCCMLL